jgi:hypothetical protein
MAAALIAAAKFCPAGCAARSSAGNESFARMRAVKRHFVTELAKNPGGATPLQARYEMTKILQRFRWLARAILPTERFR